MSTFELKTHRIGKTYSNPHFFILNKGLNSGKPLSSPCPNCFVVIISTEELKNTLFHLSMMLQIGGFYAYYLKGSVIPFISIDDCRNTLIKGLKSKEECSLGFQKLIKAVALINKKQQELNETLVKLEKLKLSFARSLVK